jgi:uroporphyrinogen decarboxylase
MNTKENDMYLENPNPDVILLMDILKGTRNSNDIKYMELIVDDEILQQYCEKYLKRKWIPYQKGNLELRAKYWDNVIECYYRLGYSGFRVSNGITFDIIMNKADDTATLSRGERKWSNHNGKINDLESFENYPWPSIENLDLWDYRYVAKHLPDGMGIFACVYGGIFEMLCEYLVGFEEMSYMSIDNEYLLDKIFTKVGGILIEAYKQIISIDKVACIFQGDDLGYTQGLMFSPDFYRKYVFPWHRELVELAHKYNKLYILHSCGNLRDIKEDLIELGIDAKHSYEDKGWSVIDFYNEMHDKMGVIGGVDVDKLCRMPADEFENYCINILDNCSKYGRYVFGSGNSIANYVPLDKFLLMIIIARNYIIRGEYT